jgi:O-antigen/teichoic acid export membrane protein
MKKQGFLEGAAVATIAIIISRIIGLIYVIPFYSLLGPQGGALYSYGYSIYIIFLSLSTSGIPIAISKIVSEYTTLGHNWTKERVYKIGSRLIFGFSFISFLILMIFSKEIAYLIIGDIQGGNTISDVTYVIRIISLALLIVPFLSVTKGYLQGQKFITTASISNIVEQVVRVLIILVGSFLALKVFNLPIRSAVGISMFAATLGALSAYIYIMASIKKYYDKMNKNDLQTDEEKSHTDSFLSKKIIKYAFPLVIIDLVKSFTGLVDTFTYVRTLSFLGYPIIKIEQAFGTLATWASKLNMIVVSIVFGITVSLIPHLVSSNVRKDQKDISKKINQSLQVLLFTIMPMTAGLYFLAQPVWVIFYGYDPFSISLFQLYVFQSITFSVFSLLIDAMQSLNNIKNAMIGLMIAFLLKLFLNIPIMHLLHNIGIDGYFGSTTANLLSYTLAIVYLLYIFRSKYKVYYKDTFKNLLKILLSTTVMYIVIASIAIFMPVNAETRVAALIQTAIYSLIGAVVYIYVSYKTKSINDIFGQRIINIVLVKLRLKKI